MSGAPSRRGFLGHVAGACLATTALGAATAHSADPVYVAMDAIRNNLLALDDNEGRLEAVYAKSGESLPVEALREERAAIIAVWQASAIAFLKTVPTTQAGMAAYLDFIDSPAGWQGGFMEAWEVDAMRSTFRAYVGGGSQI